MFSIRYNSRIKSWKNRISKYNCEGINYPSEKDDWKKFEKNDLTIVLSVLYSKKEKIYNAYVSKHNSNHEKQVILLTLIWVGFLGVRFEVGGTIIPPPPSYLKLVKVMLETWNLICKCTHICSFRKYTLKYEDLLNFAGVSIHLQKN